MGKRLFFFILFFFSSAAIAQQPRITFYDGKYFTGKKFEVRGTGDISDLRKKRRGYLGRTWNNRISSVKIEGDATVMLFLSRGFRGASVTLTESRGDLSEIEGEEWNNSASSIRYTAGPTSFVPGQVIFYEDPNYEGRSFNMFVGDEVFKLRKKRRAFRKDWDDKIESFRVFGNAKVILFADDSFKGESMVFSESMENLRELPVPWSDKASSVRVERAQ